MLQFELETDECFYQRNVPFDEQICPFPGEQFVRLLLDDEDQISS